MAAPSSAPFLPLTAPPTPAPTPADEPMMHRALLPRAPAPALHHPRRGRRAIADRARRRAIHDRRLHHARRVVVGRRDRCAADTGIADRGGTGHAGHAGDRHAVDLRDRLAGEQARADQRLLARAAVDRDGRGAWCGSGRGEGRGRRGGDRRAGTAAGGGERADTEQGRRRESRHRCRIWVLHECLLGHHPDAAEINIGANPHPRPEPHSGP